MEELQQFLQSIIEDTPQKLVLSKPTSQNPYKKTEVCKKQSGWQCSNYTQTQVFHQNISEQELFFSLVPVDGAVPTAKRMDSLQSVGCDDFQKRQGHRQTPQGIFHHGNQYPTQPNQTIYNCRGNTGAPFDGYGGIYQRRKSCQTYV